MIICCLFVINSTLDFCATLTYMCKEQIKQNIINKTFKSIPTDNLNGKTIDNTFSMFMDNNGKVYGKMSHKPTNEPQIDTGIYSMGELQKSQKVACCMISNPQAMLFSNFLDVIQRI